MKNDSENPASLLPRGMAVLLPEAAAWQRAIERVALSVFQLWGYREVVPPLFEYLDVFSNALEPELIEKSYKFVDRSNGRVMMLRPDVTPQIARIVALFMADQPKPIRLCYSAKVFRYEEEHAGREREIWQIGGELVGPQDADADAEMIALVIEILDRLGLGKYRIALGQVGYFRGLLEEMGVPPGEHGRIQKAVAGRDAARLAQILNELSIDGKEVRRILGLLELLGQEDVFDRARRLAKSEARSGLAMGSATPPSLQALSRLETIYGLLKQYGLSGRVMIDLSEVRGFDYYSGMVFEVFSEGVGYELGGGGRYDHLLTKFGEDLPSTGFALHVERLQRALGQTPRSAMGSAAAPGGDVLLIDCGVNSGTAIRLCQAMRRKGISVIRRVTVREAVDECLEQSRPLKVPYAVVLGLADLSPKRSGAAPKKGKDRLQAVWINCRTGIKKRVPIARVANLAARLCKAGVLSKQSV